MHIAEGDDGGKIFIKWLPLEYNNYLIPVVQSDAKTLFIANVVTLVNALQDATDSYLQ